MSTFWLFFLGIFLRLIFLNQSLWLDEAIEALALMGKHGNLLAYALADYQPPLYHYLALGFTKLFGYSEIALRLPSLLSGIAVIYFVKSIGEHLGGKRVGYLAGLLAATNPLLIYYSQEGRTYAMTAMLAAASFSYYIKLIPPSPKSVLRYMIPYFLVTTAMIWTSYLSWFFLASQIIYSLIAKRYALLKPQLLSALTLLAWLPSFTKSLGIGISTLVSTPEWGRVVGGLDWRSLPLTWVKFNLGRINFTSDWVYLGVVLAVGVLHFFVLRRLNWRQNRLLLWWLLPPVVLGLLTALVLPVYSYFRLLFVLPAYLLLLALGLATPKTRGLAPVVVGLQLIWLCVFWFTPSFHREDWRSFVKEATSANSVIAMPSLAQSAPITYYNDALPLLEPKLGGIPAWGSIRYVRYAEDLFDPSALGPANLRAAGYTITSQVSYPGLQVDVYENSH